MHGTGPPSQKEIARQMGPLWPIWNRFNQLLATGPMPGSAAARDGGTALGRLSWELGATALAVGVDHLIAWQLLHSGAHFQPAFAHLTLIRSAIEGGAICRWLCDPTIDTAERLGRATGVQLADYEYRAAFERGLRARVPRGGGRKTAVQRASALRRLIRHAAVTEIPLPTATKLFELYALGPSRELGGATLFRLVSSMAHARQWGIFAVSEIADVVGQGGGRQWAKVLADDALAASVTAVGLRVVSDALGNLEWYAREERPSSG